LSGTLCTKKSSSNQPPKHKTDYPSASLAPNIGLFSAPPNPVATRIPIFCHCPEERASIGEREPPSPPRSALPSPTVCRVKPTAKLPQPPPASHLPVARNRKTGSSRPPPAKGEGGATGDGVGCTGPWVGQWQRLCRTSGERRCGT
jgi:hypothetical protein